MISSRDNILDEPAPAVEEEWQIISAHWWRTPFTSVSWSYEPEKASQNVLCAKPPYYHLSLHNERAQELFDELHETLKTPDECHSPSTCKVAGEDDTLSQDLIGVKGASDVLRIYEQAVGFDYSPWPDLGSKDIGEGKRLRICVLEADVEAGKRRWNEFVEDLIGGVPLNKLLEEATKRPKVTACTEKRSALPRFNIDYTARPSTPKPSRLNPSASSFVPLGSPTSTFSSLGSSSSSDTSEHLTSFSFPSLNNSFPPLPNDKTDHQEHANPLYLHSRPRTSSDGSSVTSNERLSNGFFPSFLFDTANQRRRLTRTSRTRAIVDELRSQHQYDGVASRQSSSSSPAVSDFGINNLGYSKSRLSVSDGSSVYSTSPPLTDEHPHLDEAGISVWSDNVEGWTVPPVSVAADPETKRSRSKELLMTLRRRTDSLNSNANGAANLAAARSLGVVSVSAPPIAPGCERLVESPEHFEDASSFELADSQVHEEEEETCSERHNSTHKCASSHNLLPSAHFTQLPETTFNPQLSPFSSYKNSRIHAQAQSHGQAYPRTTNTSRYSQGYCLSPAYWLPYTLLGYPTSGVPPNFGVPESMSIPAVPAALTTAPRVGMPAPVQMPVQVPAQPMQYSTLMHLRIMQQMQMMRNSMGLGSGLPSGSMGR